MIAFIGFGRMGSALAGGALAAKVLKRGGIVAYDPDVKGKVSAKKLGIKTAKTAADAVAAAKFVFLCVKPQTMRDVMLEVVSGVPQNLRRKKCFVSIAAGIRTATLENWLGKGTRLLRVMPNTPALLGAGMSAISLGRSASPSEAVFVERILSATGRVVRLDEKAMDAVTAVSGSGPAYAFYLAEALTQAAVRLGLKPDVARTLAHQTIYGAGLMLVKRPETAEELRFQVTSPNGTTAAAIEVFEKKKFKRLVEQAVAAAAKRSAELSGR